MDDFSPVLRQQASLSQLGLNAPMSDAMIGNVSVCVCHASQTDHYSQFHLSLHLTHIHTGQKRQRVRLKLGVSGAQCLYFQRS